MKRIHKTLENILRNSGQFTEIKANDVKSADILWEMPPSHIFLKKGEGILKEHKTIMRIGEKIRAGIDAAFRRRLKSKVQIEAENRAREAYEGIVKGINQGSEELQKAVKSMGIECVNAGDSFRKFRILCMQNTNNWKKMHGIPMERKINRKKKEKK